MRKPKVAYMYFGWTEKCREEAQQQFKNGHFLDGEQADKEIKEWLGE